MIELIKQNKLDKQKGYITISHIDYSCLLLNEIVGNYYKIIFDEYIVYSYVSNLLDKYNEYELFAEYNYEVEIPVRYHCSFGPSVIYLNITGKDDYFYNGKEMNYTDWFDRLSPSERLRAISNPVNYR